MPVTAKLSQAFYDRLGNDVANELVEWFNSVDATYRTDLRELNEHSFERFDAKLGQRIAASEAKLEQRIAYLDAKLEQRFAHLDAKIDRVAAEFSARLEQRFAELKADLMKWMLVFWATNLAALIALASR
ncbi:MAG TPA: hypothetical protein VJN62_05465 [Gemmatimonadales bacterium]|nr:hypothetical protein [Gemmatimonadales bacterium]